MELALLTPHISRQGGGIKDAVLGLARSLADRADVDPAVFSVEDNFSAQDRAAWGSIPVELFASPILDGFRYAPELTRSLGAQDPDIVHTHGLWTYLSVATLKFAKSRIPPRPYVVSPHGMLDPWALRNSFWKKKVATLLFERRHLRNASCLHAVSEGEAEAFRAFGLKNPICVVSNGVDLADLTAPKPPPPWNAARIAGRKVLLYLGRLHPKKGLPLLLRAWKNAANERSGWVLAIAGWDQLGHEAELRQLVHDLGISDVVEFPGPLFGENRFAAYRNADGFVLPSLSEGQPLTVLEAWAHALPVIMTPQCNLAEGFEAGAAICCEPEASSIASALGQLCGVRDEERRSIGIRGRKLVEQSFSWSQAAAMMRSVYAWLLGGGEQPGCIIG